MFSVGLTGGMGSGKSTVAGIFEVLGIPVAYADREAKRVMAEDPELRRQLIRHFGEETYAGGQLNRPYLAAQVFADKEKLALLNSLVHPATIAAGEKWLEQQKGRAPYAIREAALIFESDSLRYMDFVIGVFAPQTLRIHRVLQRDQLSREEILQRMRSQIDEDIKMKLCDAVIYNDEQHPVIPQVLSLHEKLLRLSAAAV
ncbi:dephospho-CoA kinase [Flavitalea sp. BT771]|uniref:dephospho-CoA kinase n=1 Tax=Flavitalea sp. BT771 TaxID=3063329 RepID=UPI0026E1EE72|nr:dephospho-CoA kinase [Flavitalea sp. BT771]MDO6431202.1 dephospho-CoA kinase [Flavitalea sp. BT771]MDV6220109.1 dephospho-CoA kinase [Flavitalea sp. BT771]